MVDLHNYRRRFFDSRVTAVLGSTKRVNIIYMLVTLSTFVLSGSAWLWCSTTPPTGCF